MDGHDGQTNKVAWHTTKNKAVYAAYATPSRVGQKSGGYMHIESNILILDTVIPLFKKITDQPEH